MKIQDQLGLPNLKIPVHVSVRWLTLKSCLEVVIKHMGAIEEYILKFIPKYKPKLTKSTLYKNIVSFLNKKFFKAELQFLLSICKILIKFTEGFQSSTKILIHILYEEAQRLYITMVNRVRQNSSHYIEFQEVKKKLLPVEKVIVSEEVKKKISNTDPKTYVERDCVQFFFNVQQHYLAIAQYLHKSLSEITVLKHVRFLKPEKIKSKDFISDVEKTSKLLSLREIDNTFLQDECLLIKLEIGTYLEKFKLKGEEPSIIEFWKNIFAQKFNNGDAKYPQLSTLVKACFTLSHGNSDIERGFSVSGDILDEGNTQMAVELLNAILNIKSGMKLYDSKPHKFTVSRELIRMARQASCSYKVECIEKRKVREAKKEEEKKLKRRKIEEAKEKKEISQKKQKIEVYERNLKRLVAELSKKRKLHDEIYSLGSKRMKKGLQENNLEHIGVAENILSGLEKTKKEEKELSEKVDNLQKKINSLKDHLIKQV